MCGRYYRVGDKQAIAEYFRVGASAYDAVYAPAYSVAPSTTQPVIRQARGTEQREIVPMRWGLVGHSSEGPDPKRSTFNARAENIERSPLWRVPFQRRRCLVPVSGFYEWKKPARQAFRFTVKDSPFFALAGLWDAWKDPTNGTWLQSFSIITTEANELMAEVHDRMPVILRRRDYVRWLDRDALEQAPEFLLRPFNAEDMESHLAHPQVGNVRDQGSEMLNSV